MINQVPGGRFAPYHLEVMLNFLVIEMFIVKLTMKKIIKEYSKEDQDKLFVLKPLYQRALIVFGGPLANFY